MSTAIDAAEPSRPSLWTLPRRYLERWQQNPLRLQHGILALIGMALGYAVCLSLLALGGARPGVAPWLAIEHAHYFYWESLFIAPVILCGALLGAAVMQLLARLAGGTGSFEDTLAILCVSTSLATLPTLVPDTLLGLLLCAGIVDKTAWMYAVTHPTPALAIVWTYLLCYLIAFLVLYPTVVRVVHGLRGARALGVGWASFAIYQLFLYVFVR